MFLRFSKGAYIDGKRKYLKCLFLGDSVVMEYGDAIVGIAKLDEERDKCLDYIIVVAKECELGAKSIARRIKDLIGKSNKFTENPSKKRRKYYVDEIAGTSLPVNAQIKFSRIQ